MPIFILILDKIVVSFNVSLNLFLRKRLNGKQSHDKIN